MTIQSSYVRRTSFGKNSLFIHRSILPVVIADFDIINCLGCSRLPTMERVIG